MFKAVKIGAIGDVRLPGDSFAGSNPFSAVEKELDDLDIVILNLEGPIGCGGQPRFGKTGILHNDPNILRCFSRSAHRVFSLANNHIMDLGEDALARTKAVCRDASIECVGAGLNEDDAFSPVVLSVRGIKVGVLAASTDDLTVGSVCATAVSAGVASYNRPRFKEAVLRLRREVQCLVVVVHWGREFYAFPTPEQVGLGSLIAGLGADLIIGHHPHVVQGVQALGKTTIAYSLGNAIFPPFLMSNGRYRLQSQDEEQFLALRADFAQDQPLSVTLIGGRLNRRSGMQPYAGRKASAFHARMRELSRPLGRSYDGFYTRYEVRRRRELQWRAISHAVRKLNFSTITNLSKHDFLRQWDRLCGRGNS